MRGLFETTISFQGCVKFSIVFDDDQYPDINGPSTIYLLYEMPSGDGESTRDVLFIVHFCRKFQEPHSVEIRIF